MRARWGQLPVTPRPVLSGPMSWAVAPAVQADVRSVGRGSVRWWAAASVVTMAVAILAASVTTLVLAGRVCA